ncbi:MAG: magnesium transporter, partial [Chitinophagaceae bacterium]|nr:magnesium transporter [Anaerolineae bacterium]
MIHQITYGKVTWINIVNATPADVDRLSKMYRDIHPLNLEDLLSLSERPKLDIAETYLFVVMHFPVLDPKQRLTRSHEVDMIVGNGYVVTAHDGLLPPLNHLFKQVEESQFHREKLCGKGANHLFYVLVDQLVDYIL